VRCCSAPWQSCNATLLLPSWQVLEGPVPEEMKGEVEARRSELIERVSEVGGAAWSGLVLCVTWAGCGQICVRVPGLLCDLVLSCKSEGIPGRDMGQHELLACRAR
jgi:hypothetical protein